MIDLEPYASQFDKVYPNYGDARYKDLLGLMAHYDSPSILEVLSSEQTKRAIDLIAPLIEVKNYKSQVPFPRDVLGVVSCIAGIRTTAVSPSDVFAHHGTLFERLVETQGFQLPTVSAIFHFCHPGYFPIVDVNVESACRLLQSRFPEDFQSIQTPKLPSLQAKSNTKLESYRCFVRFLSKVIDCQRRYTPGADFRFVDKALMVFGVDRYRSPIE